jgi:acyl carrier protein
MSVTGSLAPDKGEIRAILADVLEREPAEITDEAKFATELGVDSLVALEVVVALERRYGVKLDESKLAELTCLHAVHEMMLTAMAAA